MTTYYKATRPDGTDFYTGAVDYGAALLSGEVLRHPVPEMVWDDASTHLSVSPEPTGTMLGGSWPCRLFEVEPVGTVLNGPSSHPHKRAASVLRVVREIEAHRVFGPQGEQVAELIERSGRLTREEAESLDAAWEAVREAVREAARDAARDAVWDAARAAVWDAVWDAAGDAVWDAARAAVWGAVWDTAWDTAWDAARDAVWGAVLALMVRDRISEEQFRVLYGPWASVMEA